MSEHESVIGGALRQSALRTYDQCPMRAVYETRNAGSWSSGPQALGTAFHMVAEEMLRTLWRQGEELIPTQEAVEIAREVIARPDCPHLSDQQQRDLRIMVLKFAEVPWQASRVIALEERLTAEVPCPDGRTRTVTTRPDVLMADPPEGALCIDYKTSWAVPATPRDGDYSRDSGRPYLSERGTFQLDFLGLVIMRNFPRINRVILREFYPRLGEIREALLTREELEHVEHRIGLLAQRMERDLASDGLPDPRPGRWCSHCSFSRECPVPAEQRGVGALESPAAAAAEAARYVNVDGLRNTMRDSLKAFHEERGEFIPVDGDAVLGWHLNARGGRDFKVAVPEGEPVLKRKAKA